MKYNKTNDRDRGFSTEVNQSTEGRYLHKYWLEERKFYLQFYKQ